MVNIDTVYQKVLALANKEQRGYITPQEFNLLADKAMLDIINDYFHNIKTAYYKPKNQTEGNDEAEMIQEKMGYLRSQDAVTTKLFRRESDENHVITCALPSDVYKLATLYLTTNGAESFTGVYGNQVLSNPQVPIKVPHTEIVRVSKADLLNMNTNQLTNPTSSIPVYIVCDRGGAGVEGSPLLEIYPFAQYTINETQSTLSGETIWELVDSNDTGIQGNIDGYSSTYGIQITLPGATVLVDYWKKPTTPAWGYVVVNDKALYNANTSTNFGLHPFEEETLVIRILELAGVVLKNPQLQQSAMVDKANIKKEQND